MINLTKKSTAQSISSEAQGALGLFHTALNKLRSVTEKASTLSNANEASISALMQENSQLTSVMASNNKVISNIEKLVGTGE